MLVARWFRVIRKDAVLITEKPELGGLLSTAEHVSDHLDVS